MAVMATRSYGDGITIYPHPTRNHRFWRPCAKCSSAGYRAAMARLAPAKSVEDQRGHLHASAPAGAGLVRSLFACGTALFARWCAGRL